MELITELELLLVNRGKRRYAELLRFIKDVATNTYKHEIQSWEVPHEDLPATMKHHKQKEKCLSTEMTVIK